MATDFEYLLNAMECASAEQNPAEHDYRAKRTAVLAHVSALEAERDQLRAEYAAYGVDMGRELDEVSRLRAELAACGRDAERYRRLCALVEWGEFGVCRERNSVEEFADDGEMLNAWLDDPAMIEEAMAIDAALAAKEKK